MRKCSKSWETIVNCAQHLLKTVCPNFIFCFLTISVILRGVGCGGTTGKKFGKNLQINKTRKILHVGIVKARLPESGKTECQMDIYEGQICNVGPTQMFVYTPKGLISHHTIHFHLTLW